MGSAAALRRRRSPAPTRSSWSRCLGPGEVASMRMDAYVEWVADLEPPLTSRWELYRVLSEPMRLRLLALTAEEELSIGELAELLNESQPNVSRHATALRQARLLADRREGTRTFLRVTSQALRDAVVMDALASGRELCESEGSQARIADVLRAREAPTHEYFARPGKNRVDAFPAETGAYLAAVSPLLLRTRARGRCRDW